MIVKLKDIASFSKGTQINGDDLLSDGQYAYLNGGIQPSGKWNAYNVDGNTVTISEGGNSSGYVNFMNAPFWCGAHCYYLFDLKTNGKYLFYALKSQQKRVMQLRSGACMPNIKKRDLAEFEIHIDNDAAKQQMVVTILDKVENLIEKRQQQLVKLNELVKARFVEMFGDPVSNPMNWVTRLLGDECSIITGNTPSRKVAKYYGNYIEWIKSDNINTPQAILTIAEEGLSKEGLAVGRAVDSGSILMTCIAGSTGCIGNVAIANRRVAFNQQINGIIPNRNNVWFMYTQFELSKKTIQSSINMALKGILSKGQLSEMKCIFPPIALQNEYGHFAAQIDESKLTIQQSLDKLEVLKKALMQKYFK